MDCLAGVSVAGKITPNTWKHIEKDIHIYIYISCSFNNFAWDLICFFQRQIDWKTITVSDKPSFLFFLDSWCFRICEEQPGTSWFIGFASGWQSSTTNTTLVPRHQHQVWMFQHWNLSTLPSTTGYMYTQDISPWKWEVALYCCNLLICGISCGVLSISINMIF